MNVSEHYALRPCKCEAYDLVYDFWRRRKVGMSRPSSAGSCRGAATALCTGKDGSARCGSGSDTATRRLRPMPVMMSNRLRAVLGGAGGGVGSARDGSVGAAPVRGGAGRSAGAGTGAA